MAAKPKETPKVRSLAWWAINSALGFFACFLFVVITCTIAGAYYPRTLEAMHLDWFAIPLRGLYSDCSDPSNRNAVYCRPKESKYNMRTAKIKEASKPAPFVLYDRP